MNYLKVIITVLLVIAFTVPAVSASDKYYSSDKGFKPYTKLSIGISYRTDERDALNHTPSGHLVLYGYLFPGLAMKLGAGFNLSTEFEYSNRKIREFFYESGFRFQLVQKDVSPYFELGINIIDYNNNYIVNETLVGFGIAVGGEIKLSKTTFLDLSLRHIANKEESYYIDCPSCDIYYPYYFTTDQLYNPTTIKAALNILL